jgi:two-component system, chemotaxis family, sensor kinase CheA
VALTDDLPLLENLEPEHCFLKWDITLHSNCDKDAIDEVFMFVQDEMTLTLTAVFDGDNSAPLAPALPETAKNDAPSRPTTTDLNDALPQPGMKRDELSKLESVFLIAQRREIKRSRNADRG